MTARRTPPCPLPFVVPFVSLLVLLSFVCCPTALALHFTEIMYDPPGSDADREYVELALEPNDAAGVLDLDGWTFGDGVRNASLALLFAGDVGDVALVVPAGFNATGMGCMIYSSGASLGNGLTNTGDALFLRSPNRSTLVTTSYDATSADGDGRSLEWTNGSWLASAGIGGSPCFVLPGAASANATNLTNITADPAFNATPNSTVNLTANLTTNATVNVTVNLTTNLSTNVTANLTTNLTANLTANVSRNASAHDLSLAVLLPQTIYALTPYDALFRVRDERHASGVSNEITVTVAYTLRREGVLLLDDAFSVIINAYASSKTGRLLLDVPGDVTLCGEILSVTEGGVALDDDNAANDAVCANLSVLDPMAIPCDVSLSLSFDEEVLFYALGDAIRFRNDVVRNDEGQMPPFQVRYGVRDLFGHDLAQKTTQNDDAKSYTPSFDGALGAFLFWNELASVACNNSASTVANERLVVVRGSETPATAVQETVTTAAAAARAASAANVTAQDDAVIASFYTRNERAAARITLYTTLRGDGPVQVVLAGLHDSERRTVALGPSTQLSFNATALPGQNLFLLRLLDARGKLLDEKALLLEMNATALRTVDAFSPSSSLSAPMLAGDPQQPSSFAVQVSNASRPPTSVSKPSTDASVGASSSLTGAAVAYESKSALAALPILLVLLCALLLGIFLSRRKG